MRAAWLLPVCAGLAATLDAGCKPDLGAPESLVTGPRLLALRGTPPEAAPGGMVDYDLLAVDVSGTVASPDVTWAPCLQPNPPAFTNAVSSACLDTAVTPDQGGPSPTFSAPLSADACMLFGPETPPAMKGQPPARPADPDTTGGYYQPVRAVWQSAGQTAFALERVTCRLSNAPVSAASQYAAQYTPNANPTVAELVQDPDGTAASLYAAGQAAPAPAGSATTGQSVVLQVNFADDAAETFLVWDVVSLTLLQQRESLRVSWFTTAGSFEHDVTGRGSDDPATFTQNRWTAPTTPGPVHIWAVLRDNRGGIDFASADIDVTP